jgi:hypothetical protein
MKHVYPSEKAAKKDLRIVIGYSAERSLSEPAKKSLEEAKTRLSMLTGRDLLTVILAFHRDGLSPEKPERELAE